MKSPNYTNEVKHMTATIETTRVDTEFLSIEKFMTLSERDKSNIQSLKIIPPTLDGNGFGKVAVKYKVPSYKVSDNRL
jgi:hypothetical protein